MWIFGGRRFQIGYITDIRPCYRTIGQYGQSDWWLQKTRSENHGGPCKSLQDFSLLTVSPGQITHIPLFTSVYNIFHLKVELA